MKKIFIIVLLFMSFHVLAAEEYSIFVGDGFIYNEVLSGLSDTQYAIKYDDEADVYYLYTQDWINKSWIHLSKGYLETFRRVLDKYFEWEKIAVENAVKVEKEIPESQIKTQVTWQFGDDWHNSSGLVLGFTFFSQSKKRHQLVISSNKITSSKNQFVDFKLDPLYLDKEHVTSLNYRRFFPHPAFIVRRAFFPKKPPICADVYFGFSPFGVKVRCIDK